MTRDANSSSNRIWLDLLEETLRDEATREWERDVPTMEVPLQYTYMVQAPALWRFRRWAANVLFRLGGAVAP